MTHPLPQPCLCLVTDRSVVPSGDLVDVVARAVAGGVDMVQLREKDLPGGELLTLAAELKEAVRGRALLVVNERVDVAAVVGAHGVQLGEGALPVADARRLLPTGALVGRSVHSVEGAQTAEEAGTDFLVVGTMFATASHPGEAPAGPELLQKVSGTCRIPLIGIGGITPANLGEAVGAGATGVAVIRSILGSSDPGLAARELKHALQAAWDAPTAVPNR